MKKLSAPCLFGMTILISWLLARQMLASAAQPPNFDRLSAEDRKAFQKRFDAEVWPSLMRGGKEGCVGCHSGGKIVSALRMTGDSAKDFPMLLKEGFFLPDDPGSLLNRVTDRDAKRRMPPGSRERWTNADIDRLRILTADIEKKQQN